MLCLALYNVFIIIELSTFISIRGEKMLSNSEGWAITQTCSLTSTGPRGAFLLLGEKGESPRPEAPCVLRLGTIRKNWETEGRGGRGLSGYRVPWELRTHG